jgi:hypothetical protein
MKTILGKTIPTDIRGIVYLCKFNFLGETPVLTVFREILCTDAFTALNLYAEIPNPPSQLATGKTYEELCSALEKLHSDMRNEQWLLELAESI